MDQINIAGRRLAGIVAALAASAIPGAAVAGTAGANLAVNANVTANCNVVTSSVNFGSVDTLTGAHVDATGGVTVSCTNGTDWVATADAGGGTGASFASRKMSGGGNELAYTLYTDATRTSVWGDGSGTTSQVNGTGNGSSQNFTIYGRIPGGQSSVPAGSYADTVAITITY